MKLEADFYYRLREISRLKDPSPKLVEFLKDVEPERKRTESQNNALHLNFRIIAEKLNDAGLDMKKVLKADIPWTEKSVKKELWRPFMKSMYNKTSTRQLKKQEEIDNIHKVLMRELGKEFKVEYHDFPHKKKEGVLEAQKKEINYPEYIGEPEF